MGRSRSIWGRSGRTTSLPRPGRWPLDRTSARSGPSGSSSRPGRASTLSSVAAWPTRRDPRVWQDATLDDVLRAWRAEGWLFAAAKMSRPIVGAAKVTDIETLPENLREGAARGVLNVARMLVRQSNVERRSHRISDLIGQVLREHRTR